jgi:hypothetical protein
MEVDFKAHVELSTPQLLAIAKRQAIPSWLWLALLPTLTS